MRPLRFIVTSLLLLALSALAIADDFMPGPMRGDPLSFFAEWEWLDDFEPDRYNIDPDQIDQTGDGTHQFNTSAYTHAHATETVFWGTGDGDGVAYTLDQPGQIDFFLANWFDQYPYKHLWIQITYAGQGVPYVSSVVGPNPDTNTWTDPTYGSPVEAFEVDANHRVEHWLLMPNPDREHIYLELPPFTELDQIVFDTVSSPDVVPNDEASWGEVKALYR